MILMFFFFYGRKSTLKKAEVSGTHRSPSVALVGRVCFLLHPSVSIFIQIIEFAKISRCWFFINFLSNWISWSTFSDDTIPAAARTSVFLTKTFQGRARCKEAERHVASSQRLSSWYAVGCPLLTLCYQEMWKAACYLSVFIFLQDAVGNVVFKYN